MCSSNELSIKQFWLWSYEHIVNSPLNLCYSHSTINVRGLNYSGWTYSIAWLLMHWLLASPGHQHPRWWLYRMAQVFSSMRKEFKYQCHNSVEIWYKLLIHFDVSYEKFSSLSLTPVDCPQPTWHADRYITNVLKQWSDSWNVFLQRWYSRTLVPFVWHFKQIKGFSGILYDTY